MSASWLPREQGMRIVCDGTGDEGCPKNEKRFTANIVAKHNRAHHKKEGWGRGLRKGYKRRDLCPSCMPTERELFKKEQTDTEAWKAQRAENRKAKILERAAQPKKPRKRKSSPSADSAPAASTQ